MSSEAAEAPPSAEQSPGASASDLQDAQDAYTLDSFVRSQESQPGLPVIRDPFWHDNGLGRDFHHRTAVTGHAFSSDANSVARSKASDAASMAVSAQSYTVFGSSLYENPPSLTFSNSVLSGSSLWSEGAYSAAKIGPLDEEGVLNDDQYQPVQPLYTLHCLFGFLGCRRTISDFQSWYIHSKTHFQGKSPPTKQSCPFEHCPWTIVRGCGHKAWDERGVHLIEDHNILTEASGPWTRRDSGLFQHLFNCRVIEKIQLQELKRHGQLGVDQEAFVTTEGPGRHRRREGGPPRTTRLRVR